MSLLSVIFVLFLVMDPLGNIPLFLTALKDVESHRRNKIIFRELVIALFVLVFFLLFGRFILALLQINEPSLSIAGGIILFIIALRMIFPSPEKEETNPKEEPFIVPLAIPLVAGPSALTTVLLLVTKEPSRWLEWLLSLFCAWVISAGILLCSSGLQRFFGQRGLIAMERLMGMILTTIAVQMFLTGLRQFLEK
jgi:multiple antibiotic resistance protein